MMDVNILGGDKTRMDFEWTNFDEDFVTLVKTINGAESYEADDKLVKAWGWIHGNSGFTRQFQWASGRVDAIVTPDVEGEEAAKGFRLITEMFFGTANDQILTVWEGLKNVA